MRISYISEKADHVKFLEQVISYTSLRTNQAQYYIQAGGCPITSVRQFGELNIPMNC